MRPFEAAGCEKTSLLVRILDNGEFAGAFLCFGIPHGVMSCDADFLFQTLFLGNEVIRFAGTLLGLRIPDGVVCADAYSLTKTDLFVVENAFTFFRYGTIHSRVSRPTQESAHCSGVNAAIC